MKKIWKLELLRILRTRSTLLFLAAALVLSVFMAWVPVTYVTFSYEENGRETTLKGPAALAMRKRLRSATDGEVTPGKMAAGLAAYRENTARYGDPNSKDFPAGIYASDLFPYAALTARLKEVMADADTGAVPDYAAISEADALGFYDRCRIHVSDLMRMEQRDNPAAVALAEKMYAQIQPPFYYYEGYDSNMAEYLGLYLFLLTLLCALVTAPLFCAEYQTGADDILRSTKYGRRTLAAAKILSALCVSAALFSVCMTVFLLISNSIFGWDSCRTSLQMLFSASCLLPVNIGQMQGLVTLAGLIALLSCVSLILFVSAACRNTTAATGLTIALCLFPSVFYMMTGSDLAAWLRVLLPSGALGGTNSFFYALTFYFEFLKIGPWTVWTPWLMLAVPAAEIPLFLLLSVRTYCRRSL